VTGVTEKENTTGSRPLTVTPAKAGVHSSATALVQAWAPAFAGVTKPMGRRAGELALARGAAETSFLRALRASACPLPSAVSKASAM